MKYPDIKRYADILFYCGFLPMIIALVPVGKWITKYPDFAVTLIVFLYSLYFSIQKMNLPQKFMQKKYFQTGIFIIVILGLTWLLSRFPYPSDTIDMNNNSPGLSFRRRPQTVWFMSLLVIGFSLAVSLMLELFRQILIKKSLEEQKKNAELALYKAQINPHFFFNTLNTLYGLVVCKSDKAEDAFVRFSGLIKYTYMRVRDEKVALSEETEYIRNYIELQRLRLGRHTKVRFSASSRCGDPMIPPMILISFVENAFKYGTSSHRDSEISISISFQDNILDFHCTNDIMHIPSGENETSIGIGNTIARLERIYPDRFKLETKENNGIYIVELQIKCT